jgi:hypothetical protein
LYPAKREGHVCEPYCPPSTPTYIFTNCSDRPYVYASVATFDLLPESAALPRSCATTGTLYKSGLITLEGIYALPTPTNDMSRLQEKSRSDLDEKNDIEHIEETHLEIDLTKYHEQRAGRLVLDPKCVCFISFYYYAFLITHTTVRRALSLVMRLHRA